MHGVLCDVLLCTILLGVLLFCVHSNVKIFLGKVCVRIHNYIMVYTYMTSTFLCVNIILIHGYTYERKGVRRQAYMYTTYADDSNVPCKNITLCLIFVNVMSVPYMAR